MPKYQLNIDFEPNDLKTIAQAGEQVVLIKNTNGGTPVAWVSIDPFSNNTVEWEEDYAIYVSNVEVVHGTKIYKMSDVAAKPMASYPFTEYGAIGSPAVDKSLTLGQYSARNNFQKEDILCFGLAQGVQVNGVDFTYSPVNAQLIPRNQQATFAPLNELIIFLDGKLTEGMVITEVNSQATVLTYGGNLVNLTIKYDSHSGLFIVK